MKYLLIACCALCLGVISCRSSKLVTQEQFVETTLGEDCTALRARLGVPYEVRQPRPGVEEYVYIERIQVSANRMQFNEYVFTVVNGKVIGKSVNTSSSPMFQFQ